MPARSVCLIGVDSSTQSTTVCAYTPRGRRLARAWAPHRISTPRPLHAEQDPRTWSRALMTALQAVRAELDGRTVAAIGVAFQRETFSLADPRGRYLRPAILWLDGRARREVTELERDPGRHFCLRVTGKPLDTTSAVARLRWLNRHESGHTRHAAHWVDVGSALSHALTGRRVTCVAGADTCGLIDLRRRDWSEPLVHAAGLCRRQLPELAEAGEILGGLTRDAARTTGLPGGLPVVAAGGDGQVFSAGMGALRPGALSLTLGTSVVLGLPSRTPTIAPFFRTLLATRDLYLLECVLQSGTYLLKWFTREFGGSEAEWERRAARIAPGANGLITLPHWWGVRFPESQPDARGVTLGWSNEHTRAHFYRSLLEGIALELRRALDEMARHSPRGTTREIRAGGGGMRSRLWPRILASTLQRPVRGSTESESTALGAAMWAAVGAGCFRNMAQAADAMARPGCAVQPDRPTGQRYQSLFRKIYIPLLGHSVRASRNMARVFGTR